MKDFSAWTVKHRHHVFEALLGALNLAAVPGAHADVILLVVLSYHKTDTARASRFALLHTLPVRCQQIPPPLLEGMQRFRVDAERKISMDPLMHGTGLAVVIVVDTPVINCHPYRIRSDEANKPLVADWVEVFKRRVSTEPL